MDWFKKTADLEICKFLERGLLLNGSREGGGGCGEGLRKFGGFWMASTERGFCYFFGGDCRQGSITETLFPTTA